MELRRAPVAPSYPNPPSKSTKLCLDQVPFMPGNFFQGLTPPAGTSTGTRTSTANADLTTVTASSGDSTSPGGSTHTTNGVAAPPVGHGNRIPEYTTHPEHIDLAKKRVENLGKIAAKRKLNPHEQDIYDNALRVRHRNTPAQTGDRNTGNPQDQQLARDEQGRSSPEDLSRAVSFGSAPMSEKVAVSGKADNHGPDSGTGASSQTLPIPGPINSRPFAERQVENIHLLTTRPPRRSPFSDKVRVTAPGVHGQALRKAALLIDHAHDDGGTTELIMSDKITKANTLGNYLDGTANIRPNGPHPLMTSFHETGHHVAMTMLDDAALERVRDVASDTPRWAELFELNKHTPDFDLQYYIDPHEIFARAYAQTIAMRTKDVEALTELEWILKHQRVYFKQWPAEQFTRLQQAVEAELHKIKWL